MGCKKYEIPLCYAGRSMHVGLDWSGQGENDHKVANGTSRQRRRILGQWTSGVNSIDAVYARKLNSNAF